MKLQLALALFQLFHIPSSSAQDSQLLWGGFGDQKFPNFPNIANANYILDGRTEKLVGNDFIGFQPSFSSVPSIPQLPTPEDELTNKLGYPNTGYRMNKEANVEVSPVTSSPSFSQTPETAPVLGESFPFQSPAPVAATPNEIEASYRESLVHLKSQNGHIQPGSRGFAESFDALHDFPQISSTPSSPPPVDGTNFNFQSHPQDFQTFHQLPLLSQSFPLLQGSVKNIPISVQQQTFSPGFSVDVHYPPKYYFGSVTNGAHLKADFHPSEPDTTKFSIEPGSYSSVQLESGFQPSFGPPTKPEVASNNVHHTIQTFDYHHNLPTVVPSAHAPDSALPSYILKTSPIPNLENLENRKRFNYLNFLAEAAAAISPEPLYSSSESHKTSYNHRAKKSKRKKKTGHHGGKKNGKRRRLLLAINPKLDKAMFESMLRNYALGIDPLSFEYNDHAALEKFTRSTNKEKKRKQKKGRIVKEESESEEDESDEEKTENVKPMKPSKSRQTKGSKSSTTTSAPTTTTSPTTGSTQASTTTTTTSTTPIPASTTTPTPKSSTTSPTTTSPTVSTISTTKTPQSMHITVTLLPHLAVKRKKYDFETSSEIRRAQAEAEAEAAAAVSDADNTAENSSSEESYYEPEEVQERLRHRTNGHQLQPQNHIFLPFYFASSKLPKEDDDDEDAEDLEQEKQLFAEYELSMETHNSTGKKDLSRTWFSDKKKRKRVKSALEKLLGKKNKKSKKVL